MHSMQNFIQDFSYYLNTHRTASALILGLVFWGIGYVWYFRGMVLGLIRRGQPHSWRVDMVHKSAYSHGRKEVE